MGRRTDAIVIGAGPYGMSVTTHLHSAGVDATAFGRPMDFWEQHMPVGMFLRSSWSASHISHPDDTVRLEDFERHSRTSISKPIPLENFIDYGKWFQTSAVPDLNRRFVSQIKPDPNGFVLDLEDGEKVETRRVVIATGIGQFPWRPPMFDELPHSLVSHSSQHCDYGSFSGRAVVVVGGGQSALESAALLREAGADVEILVRSDVIHWLMRRKGLEGKIGPLWGLLYPPTDVGPPVLNRIVAKPNLFRQFPKRWQELIAQRSIRPAAAAWLHERLESVPITTGRRIVSALKSGLGLKLRLDDRTERRADHLLLATGFRIDVSLLPFLSKDLVEHLHRSNGYPVLGPTFESSVPGLFFVGATAAQSFGPLMRFVSGTEFTARTLAESVRAPEMARSRWTVHQSEPEDLNALVVERGSRMRG